MPVIRQRHIKVDELANFLKSNIEPLDDRIYGNRYRAAVRLTDDTYLPCVVFQSKKSLVELALRRFDQLRSQPSQYKMVVESFVASGSHINYYEIKTVEPISLCLASNDLKANSRRDRNELDCVRCRDDRWNNAFIRDLVLLRVL